MYKFDDSLFDLPHKMKFPITRESLQSFDYVKDQQEIKEEELQKELAKMVENLCKEFKETMSSNSKEKRFIWKDRDTRIYVRIQPIPKHGSGIPDLAIKPDEYFPLFIEKLKEIFIGCDIISDPLKTYLIIDWS